MNTTPDSNVRSGRFSLFATIAVVGIISVFVFVELTIPNATKSRDRRYNRMLPRMESMNNLRQIAIAILHYEADHNGFPPAYLEDANGVRTHSWRTLILPYLDEPKLLKEYSFDEPWNGPNNRQLTNCIPKVFRSPLDKGSPPSDTSYVAIVGPETMWPGSDFRRLEEIIDGASNTVLLVEMGDSGINWMQPDDLDFSKMTLNAIRTNGRSGAHVVYADGAVRVLYQNTVDENHLQALCTARGGESLSEMETRR